MSPKRPRQSAASRARSGGDGRDRALADLIPEVIARFDRDLRHTYLNAYGARVYGIPVSEVIGRTNAELGMPPDKVAFWNRHFEEVFATGEGRTVDFEFEGPTFGRQDFSSLFVPERDATEQVVSILAITRDVTAIRRAEDAARESHARYRDLFTNMTEGFALGEAICDEGGVPRDFRFLEMNDAFERQSGLDRQAALGRPMREVLPHLEQSWVDTYGAIALGAPARRFESYNGDLARHFSVYCYSPRRGQFAILFSDITERKQADENLRRTSAVLNAINAATPVLVAVKDRDSRVVLANPAVLQLIGRPESEVYGHDDIDFYGPELGAAVVENDRRTMRDGTTIIVEEHTPDGRTFLSTKTPWRDEQGNVHGVIVVALDITDRKRSEEALAEADRRKNEFLATLAHELRNPLAPIRFALHLLAHADVDRGAAERSRLVIERQVNQLVRLVDDLLDVSRITRNTIHLRTQPVRLHELMRTAIETTEPHLRAAGHTLLVEWPPEDPELNADPARLVQVFGNLLNNAVKFTPAGGQVFFGVACADGHVAVTVRDSGIGIRPEALAHVFDMFHQVESGMEHAVGGLGIGLTIARRLVEMHGGTITVASDGADRGAEFTVRLPLPGTVREVARPVATATPAGAAAARLSVLIVDDNIDLAQMLELVIGAAGHATRVVHDGPSALAEAERFAPDVVLLDIGLPGMNGYEVARELRRRAGHAVGLVALTGWGQPEDRRQAREAGFDCHMTKPADADRVLGYLEAVAHRRECAGCSACLRSPLTRESDSLRGA